MSIEIHLLGAMTTLPARLDDMVISVFLNVPDTAALVVTYSGCPSEHGLAAATTTQLSCANIGAQVVLTLVAGNPRRPLLIGRIQRLPQGALAQLDSGRLKFSAEHEIVLHYGETSITLAHTGKVIIHDAHLPSHSTGINRAKGGSVRIN